MTIKQIITKGLTELKDFDNPKLESQLLIQKITGKDKTYMMTHLEEELDSAAVESILKLYKRRQSGYPIHYLLGEREFMGLDFYVEPGVLVPRPDTEVLVEKVIALLEPRTLPPDTAPEILLENPIKGLEAGTGSGVIALSLLAFIPNLYMLTTDINPRAIELARKNSARHKLLNRVNTIESDLFDRVHPDEKFDFVISNPPYIASPDIASLPVEIRDFEPRNALDGGQDGLDYYRRLCQEAKERLLPGGMLAVEIGAAQGFDVRDIFLEARYQGIEICQDLAGRDRVVIAYLS